MARIRHRFSSHLPAASTEILFLGTFNPDTPENDADFFYGRKRNFLWTLLPQVFGEMSLKNSSTTQKRAFIRRFNLDFLDLILEVNVAEVANYRDDYLDDKITSWRDVIAELERLQHLRKVCFTRKTFSGIPNIRKQLEVIRAYCESRKLEWILLPTPTRGYTAEKQAVWTSLINP